MSRQHFWGKIKDDFFGLHHLKASILYPGQCVLVAPTSIQQGGVYEGLCHKMLDKRLKSPMFPYWKKRTEKKALFMMKTFLDHDHANPEKLLKIMLSFSKLTFSYPLVPPHTFCPLLSLVV